MPDEIDREVVTKKSVSHPNPLGSEYRVSEQHSTRVNTDNSATGLILGVLVVLGVGAGAGWYFLNNRPSPTQIIVPGTDTIRENKSTIIERNNTTTKEVTPSTPQSTPNVEINIPAATVTQTAAPTPSTQTAAPTPAAQTTTTPSPVRTQTATPGVNN